MTARVLPMEHHGRHLVGMLSMPDDRAPKQSWLFLSPFGQEAIRTAPMYRSLADRLGRAGCAALRFDYHGTGDSAGEIADQSLDDWIGDACYCIELLRSTSGVTRLTLFGVGLGATIATLAAARQSSSIAEMLLWEPVIDGAKYLAALMRSHRREVALGFDMAWDNVRAKFDEPEPTAPGHLVGFEIGPKLATQISETKSLPLIDLANRGIRSTVASREEEVQRAIGSHPLVQLVAIEMATDWMTNEALGTALVPQQLIALIDHRARAA